MCDQSGQALTVVSYGMDVACEMVVAPSAAAEFDNMGHPDTGKLEQPGCRDEPLIELAESGAPISQVLKSVP